jgi:hypothetical protein
MLNYLSTLLEDVWGSGCIDPRCLVFGTRWGQAELHAYAAFNQRIEFLVLIV